jgi:hypothetical protein
MTEDVTHREEALKWRLVGLICKGVIDIIFATSRIEVEGEDRVRPLLSSRRFIAAFWHSRILGIGYRYQGWKILALVSRSEDGEIIAQTLRRQGYEPVRGSTSRGGLRALSLLIKRMKRSSRPVVIIPDGPRGPRFRAQPGIILLSSKTGYPILPVTYSARRIKIFGSWDRFILPAPFNRCRIAFGTPISVPANAGPGTLEHCRRLLETELNRITRKTDGHFGHHIG